MQSLILSRNNLKRVSYWKHLKHLSKYLRKFENSSTSSNAYKKTHFQETMKDIIYFLCYKMLF